MYGVHNPKIASTAGNHLAAVAAALVQRHRLSGEGNVTLYNTEMEKECEAQTGRPQSQCGACGQERGGSPPDALVVPRHAQASKSPTKLGD